MRFQIGENEQHAFLKFTDSYDASFTRAQSMNWCQYELAGSHFHPINEPKQVADALADAATELM